MSLLITFQFIWKLISIMNLISMISYIFPNELERHFHAIIVEMVSNHLLSIRNLGFAQNKCLCTLYRVLQQYGEVILFIVAFSRIVVNILRISFTEQSQLKFQISLRASSKN